MCVYIYYVICTLKWWWNWLFWILHLSILTCRSEVHGTELLGIIAAYFDESTLPVSLSPAAHAMLLNVALSGLRVLIEAEVCSMHSKVNSFVYSGCYLMCGSISLGSWQSSCFQKCGPKTTWRQKVRLLHSFCGNLIFWDWRCFTCAFHSGDNSYTQALLRIYLTYSVLDYLLLKCHFEIIAYSVLAFITASKVGEIYWPVCIDMKQQLQAVLPKPYSVGDWCNFTGSAAASILWYLTNNRMFSQCTFVFFLTRRPLVQAGVCAFLEVLMSTTLEPAVSTIVFPALWKFSVSEVGLQAFSCTWCRATCTVMIKPP